MNTEVYDSTKKENLLLIDAIEEWKLNFNLGNVVKYIARADYKADAIEDLKKASWYLNREIERRTASNDC